MEVNKRRCKTCKVLQDRILAGCYPNGNKRWLDYDGKAWNGSKCGSCHKTSVAEALRRKRGEAHGNPV